MDAEGRVEMLARVLFEKMEHLDPSPDGDAGWEGLSDFDKEFYVTCIEAVLAAYNSPTTT